MRKRLFLLVTFLSVVLSVNGQQSLDEFSVSQVGENVRIKFTMRLGAQCTGVQIFRGSDTLNVEEIGEISGICGSTSEPVTYFYIDHDPIYNESSFYRLNLGILGYSGFVKHTALRFNNQQILLYPNPVSNSLNVNIRKPFNSPVELQFVNTLGEVSQVFYYSAGEALRADVSQMVRGVYFLKIIVGNEHVGTERLILQ